MPGPGTKREVKSLEQLLYEEVGKVMRYNEDYVSNGDIIYEVNTILKALAKQLARSEEKK